jgi:uncharacterized protein YjbJ (UPF0337 family)
MPLAEKAGRVDGTNRVEVKEEVGKIVGDDESHVGKESRLF